MVVLSLVVLDARIPHAARLAASDRRPWRDANCIRAQETAAIPRANGRQGLI